MLVASTLAEPDAGRAAGATGRCDAVIDDPDRAADEIGAVGVAGETERLGQPGGSGAQIAVSPGLGPTGAHLIESGGRGAGAEQHRGRHSVGAGDHVGAPVHAVREVHVQMTGGSKHGLVSSGGSVEGVAAGVFAPRVRLDLDDPGGQPFVRRSDPVEDLVEE
jgi:hypothetical protein